MRGPAGTVSNGGCPGDGSRRATLRQVAPGPSPRANPIYKDLVADPDTGSETVAGVLPPLSTPDGEPGLLNGQATLTGGSLFILQPPYAANTRS